MAKQGERGAVRRSFQRARDVKPRRITGREKPTEIIEGAFPAYVGRQERTAFQLMRKCVADGAAVFLTLSGAMTPAGLHQSCLIPLIERGIIDCITTTGANLYHDAHRVIGHRIREIARGDRTLARPLQLPHGQDAVAARDAQSVVGQA